MLIMKARLRAAGDYSNCAAEIRARRKDEQNQYAIKLSAAELAANIFLFTIVEVAGRGRGGAA